jgi:predicted urease superfamily metal-dependent hydrolase
MKKMIIAALALIAINAQAQTAPAIAPSLFSHYDAEMACVDGDNHLNQNCMDAQTDMALRKQYHLDDMTEAQKKAAITMMEQMLKDEQK